MKNMIATLTIIIILSCSALHAADTAVADMTEGNGTVTSAGLLYVSETSDYKLSIAHLFGLLDSDLISWQAITRAAGFDTAVANAPNTSGGFITCGNAAGAVSAGRVGSAHRASS